MHHRPSGYEPDELLLLHSAKYFTGKRRLVNVCKHPARHFKHTNSNALTCYGLRPGYRFDLYWLSMPPRSILFLICFTTRQLLTERSCQLDMETLATVKGIEPSTSDRQSGMIPFHHTASMFWLPRTGSNRRPGD